MSHEELDSMRNQAFGELYRLAEHGIAWDKSTMSKLEFAKLTRDALENKRFALEARVMGNSIHFSSGPTTIGGPKDELASPDLGSGIYCIDDVSFDQLKSALDQFIKGCYGDGLKS